MMMKNAVAGSPCSAIHSCGRNIIAVAGAMICSTVSAVSLRTTAIREVIWRAPPVSSADIGGTPHAEPALLMKAVTIAALILIKNCPVGNPPIYAAVHHRYSTASLIQTLNRVFCSGQTRDLVLHQLAALALIVSL